MTQRFGIKPSQAGLSHLLLMAYQIFDLHQEPGVDVGQPEHTINTHAGTEGIGNVPNTLGTGFFELTAQSCQGFRVIQVQHRVKTTGAHFQASQGFLQ